MPLIPRPVKPPTRIALTCKLPEAMATLLKRYAEFLDSTQEYVVVETLSLAFRRDKEFQTWLATRHPPTRAAERDPHTRPTDPDQPRPTPASAGRPDARGEHAKS